MATTVKTIDNQPLLGNSGFEDLRRASAQAITPASSQQRMDVIRLLNSVGITYLEKQTVLTNELTAHRWSAMTFDQAEMLKVKWQHVLNTRKVIVISQLRNRRR